MSLLEIEHVTRRFGGIVALDDVSMEVPAGAIAGLIGPNGAGKTTLFNVATLLYRPSSGEVRFDGRSLLRARPHQIASRGIARTFQNVELFRTMTVLENVLVGMHTRLPAGRRADGERGAVDALDYVGVADIAHRPVVGLPFGTLKRVELARALATRPRLLLLDEPASGLTHEEVADLPAFIRRMRDDFELTILLVEHHMNLVMGVSETVHVLDFGRMIASGTPAEVRTNQAVIDAYLGVEDDDAAA